MFNLNEQIGKWRTSLMQSQTLATADIDELESHLREEIQSLKQLKLSDEEALLIAARRLGNTHNLSNEYAKINQGRVLAQKTSCMIGGVLIYMVIISCARVVSKGCIEFAIKSGMSDYGSLALVGLVAQVLVAATIVLLVFFLCRLTIRVAGFRRRIDQLSERISLLTILFVFLATVFCYSVALHIPAPVFRSMSIENHATEALAYTQLLWAVLLPAILVMVLVKLRAPRSDRAQTT